MAAQHSGYLSFLLRLWREDQPGYACWRASLESPATGERASFADLEGLCAFLRTKTDPGGVPPTTGSEQQRSCEQRANDM